MTMVIIYHSGNKHLCAARSPGKWGWLDNINLKAYENLTG